MPGNFASVIKAYLASPKFEALAEETRYGYRNELADAEEFLGHFSVDVIKPSIVQGFLDGLSDFPGKQIKSRVALKAVEKWAIVRDLLPYPITLGTEVVGSDGGHQPWTALQVDSALACVRPDLGRAIALCLKFWTEVFALQPELPREFSILILPRQIRSYARRRQRSVLAPQENQSL